MNTNIRSVDRAALSHFDNIGEWLAYAETGGDRHAKISDDFTNYTTAAQYGARIKSNDAPQVIKQKIQNALEVSAPEQIKEVELLDIYHDEAGLFVDMTAYTMGESDCMVNFDIISAERRTLWIVAPFGASAMASDTLFANRGVALIRAVKHLQASGIDVGVVGYSTCSTGAHGGGVSLHTQTVVIKQPQNELAESDFINVFATCNALRSVGFGVRCADIKDSNGATETIPLAHLVGSTLEHEQVLIIEADPTMSNFKTAQKSEQFILEQVNKALTKVGA